MRKAKPGGPVLGSLLQRAVPLVKARKSYFAGQLASFVAAQLRQHGGAGLPPAQGLGQQGVFDFAAARGEGRERLGGLR